MNFGQYILAHSAPFCVHLTAEDMLAFLAKAIIVSPTWFALLIWAFVKVLPNSGIFAQKAKLWQCALMGLAERAQ